MPSGTSRAGTPTGPKHVYAAGCVVYRRTSEIADGEATIELLVAHRPRYDDWSFPKGKRDKGETDLDCAIREVQEETAAIGTIGSELETVHYFDHKRRPKHVRYWIMHLAAKSPPFLANDEVDRIQWLTPERCRNILTYHHDRDLIDQFLQAMA